MTKQDFKTTILYFSPTGNCQRIAQKIAASMEGEVTLISLTQSLTELLSLQSRQVSELLSLSSCDLMFIVVPVYSQLCPSPIKKLLKKLDFVGAAVPCVSYGSVSAGRALHQICSILQKKKAKIPTAAEFASSHCYLAHDDSSPHSRQDAAIDKLCQRAKLHLEKGIFLNKITPQHFNPCALIAPNLRAKIAVRPYSVDKNLCDRCEKCRDNCPFGAIDADLTINKKCQRCGACVTKCDKNNRRYQLHPILHKYLKKYVNYSKNSKIY